VQTAAVALAPLGGGALGAIDWRLAFVSQSVVALALATMPPADGRKTDEIPRLRSAFTRRVGLLSGAAFTGYAGVTGVGFLVAVLAADEFGLESITRGVLLAGFGVAGWCSGARPAAPWIASAACR
jgi:predicted MFS family arabinose efflux permease